MSASAQEGGGKWRRSPAPGGRGSARGRLGPDRRSSLVWFLACSPSALTLARAIDHPYSQALALAYACATYQMRRDLPELRNMVDELRQQYVLAIEATGQHEWRRLDVRVRVKHPATTVKARSGYFGG